MCKEKIFSQRITESLRNAKTLWDPQERQYMITGGMDLKTSYAHITVVLPNPLKSLRESPPVVYCKENWVKPEADWHVYPDKSLCWIIQPVWDEVNGWATKPRRLIAEDSAAMLLESVSLLLSRHLWASKTGETMWRPEWHQYSHGNKKAYDEYEQDLKLRRFHRDPRKNGRRRFNELRTARKSFHSRV